MMTQLCADSYAARIYRHFASAVFGMVTVLLAMTPSTMFAADKVWIQNSDGDWTADSPWSPFGSPNDSTKTVQIDDGDASVTVTLDAVIGIKSLSLGTNDTLAIRSGFTNTSLTSAEGFINDGTIRLTGSSTSTERLTVSSGTLTNSVTGLLDFAAGGGVPRFDGDLINNGIISVGQSTSFDKLGGEYTNNGRINVNAGTLSITNNGLLTNLSGVTLVGGMFDLTGTLELPFADIRVNQSELGLRGSGVHIRNSFTNSDALAALDTNGPTGKLRILDGGNFTTTAGAFSNNGLLELSGGQFAVATLDNSSTGTIIGNGSISATLLNSGVFSPGPSADAIEVLGNYIQMWIGTLDIGIGGNDNSDTLNLQYDQLTAGSLSLDGMMTLTLFDNFTPAFDDEFTILDANTLSGEFANVLDGERLTTVGEEGSFVVHYNAADATVTLGEFVLSGDYNLNGTIDAADYVVWRKDPLHTPAGYTLWKSNFGRSTSGGGAGASVATGTEVPEPVGLCYLLVGAAWLLGFRSRSKSGFSPIGSVRRNLHGLRTGFSYQLSCAFPG